MDRVERLIGVLADKQEKLDNLVSLLVEAQIKTQENFRETDKRLLEMKRESDVRERRLDERIEKLASAIGEMLSRQNGKKH